MQVSFGGDLLGRAPIAALERWPEHMDLARAAAREGAEVHVVMASRDDHPPFEHEGAEVHFVSDPTHLLPIRLVERIASLRPELIHIHSLGYFRQTAYLSLRVPRARILAQDHADKPLRGWRRIAQKWALSRISAVSFTAKEQAISFHEAEILPRSTPIFEILERSSTFSPGDRDDARRATGLFGDPCLLWVGSLDRNKDPFTVLDAIELALPDLPDLELWCCYRSSPELAQVRARLERSSRLRRKVHLLGERSRPELELHHRAADFFVLASHREGSCYSAIEAMACGTPPILTDIPVLRRITGEGAAGALFPVEHARSMRDRLISLARAERAAGRARTREHFNRALSMRAQQEQLIEAYRAVLNSPHP